MGGGRDRQRVGAYALVQDGSGRLLLCRMSSRTRTPGWWTLPGGGLRHGEAPEDAVLREVAEETGLSGEVRRLVGVHSNTYESNGASLHGIRLIYQVTTSGESTRPEVGETTDDTRWFARDAIEALDLSDHARYGLGLLAPGTGQACVDTPSTRAL